MNLVIGRGAGAGAAGYCLAFFFFFFFVHVLHKQREDVVQMLLGFAMAHEGLSGSSADFADLAKERWGTNTFLRRKSLAAAIAKQDRPLER